MGFQVCCKGQASDASPSFSSQVQAYSLGTFSYIIETSINIPMLMV